MQVSDRHRGSRWQFSLRTLLFLMSVVAFSSMLVGLSAVLAVVIVPFFAIALVRTLRINGQAADDAGREQRRRGLVATFFGSLVLILTLLVVSIATALFACVAAFLVVLDLMARFCKPFVARSWPVLQRAGRIALPAARRVASLVSYSNMQRFLNWTSAYAMLATRHLVAATSVLHRRYWRLDLRK